MQGSEHAPDEARVAQLEAALQAMQAKLAAAEARVQDLEGVVEQLNDTSTQPSAARDAPPAVLSEVQRKLRALEDTSLPEIRQYVDQQVAILKGSTQRVVNGAAEKRVTMVQLHTSLENQRKRLANLETVQGASELVARVKNLDLQACQRGGAASNTQLAARRQVTTRAR